MSLAFTGAADYQCQQMRPSRPAAKKGNVVAQQRADVFTIPGLAALSAGQLAAAVAEDLELERGEPPAWVVAQAKNLGAPGVHALRRPRPAGSARAV
jgi:hypothetical protein